MKNVGQVLKQARKRLGLTLDQIAKETKIKKKFLIALENSDWQSLPGFSISAGFAKVYAKMVGVDPVYIAALLRRDFPINDQIHRKEANIRFSSIWTPKATIFAVVLLAILAAGLYILRQYLIFVSPPPLQNIKVNIEDGQAVIVGETRPNATVTVEGQTVLVSNKGKFKAVVDLAEIGDFLEIKATSRSGKTTLYKKKLDSLQ